MSSSNCIGEFNLDKIILRKKLDMNNQDITNVETIDATNVNATFVAGENLPNSNILQFSPYSTDPFSYWTYDTALGGTTFSATIRVPYFSAIYLPANFVVNNIFFFTGAIPLTNSQVGLYDGNGTLLASSNSVVQAVSQVNKRSMISPYTIPTSGIYYCAYISSSNGSVLSGRNVNQFLINYPNITNQVGTLTGFRVCLTTAQPTTELPSTLSGLTISPHINQSWFAVS